MWKKIAIGGAVAAAILGSGAAALATSGSAVPGTPSASAAPAAAKGRHPVARALARHTVHGQFVTRDDSGGFVTHDVIKGTVTSVSATSITVKAADNTSETYVVSSSTKVRQRSNGKGTASTIGAVHTGDEVAVVGTGTSTLTATGIVDVTK